MMARVAVDIKWEPISQTFWAYDKATGKPIPRYDNLSYGGAKDDFKDDPTESIKGFTDAIILLGKFTDTSPKKDAVMTGWCDVP